MSTMYSDEELASAVNAGVMTENTANKFRQHVASERAVPAVDEEHFQLITGFNDIFVVIASVLLLASVSWIGNSISPATGAFLQVITAWGLAEYFTRQRHMALPSIVLLLSFVLGVFVTGFALLASSSMSDDLMKGVLGIITAFAAWLHWQRFKVPITIAAGTAILIIAVMFLLFWFIPESRTYIRPITFVTGILVFLFAMRWDSSDTKRQTGRSDVAFWLHLIAAPLIVHPVFSALMTSKDEVSSIAAVTVATLYIVIALVSISIDRRALMVSALAYVLYALNSILEQ
ncbi:MAG: hypothetical protein IMF04_02450, partial [Proteobacteria bacterium]|nr:hypothetical protein [Pseudomonadota bacterium]